jgi:hypothetical protein
MAPAGGICISSSVHEAVGNKISLKFDDLGLLQLKNIPERVHAYAVALDEPQRRSAPRPTVWQAVAMATLLMIAVLGTGIYLLTRSILPLGTSSAVEHASPQTIAASETPAVPTSPAEEKKPAPAAADASTRPGASPTPKDEAKPAAAPTAPAAQKSRSDQQEKTAQADTGAEACLRYLPSIGKSVEVPCDQAQDHPQEPETKIAEAKQESPEVKVFTGQWSTTQSACDRQGLEGNERKLIFGPGSATYLAPLLVGRSGGYIENSRICTNLIIDGSGSDMSLAARCSDAKSDLSLRTSGDQLVGFGPDGQSIQLKKCN